MKKIMLVLAFLGLICSTSFAGAFDFETTGLRAEYYDSGSFGQAYIPTSPISPGDPVGGYLFKNAASEAYGYAYQFTVDQTTHFEGLHYDLNLRDDNDPYFGPDNGIDSLSFDWKLYGGSTTYHDSNILLPDTKTLLASDRANLVNANPGDKQFSDLLAKFDLQLQPGTDYWLAYELNGGPRANAYISNVHGITGPEPSSLALLSVGLVGLLRRRKVLTA